MSENVHIRSAAAADAPEIAAMVGELLTEIVSAGGIPAFNFNHADTVSRLTDFFNREKYFAFVARDRSGAPVGFVTLYESCALYTEGIFGTIPEFYVRPDWRSSGIGRRLASQAKAFGRSRGWKRLEVTTPPLPPFEKTLAFYEREGFAIAGGRKLKVSL